MLLNPLAAMLHAIVLHVGPMYVGMVSLVHVEMVMMVS